VYFVDPIFAGGTITPIATQNEANFLNLPGYFLIGCLVTPASSPRYQPSSYADVGTSATVTPTAAYDNNTNTSAVISGSYRNNSVAPMPSGCVSRCVCQCLLAAAFLLIGFEAGISIRCLLLRMVYRAGRLGANSLLDAQRLHCRILFQKLPAFPSGSRANRGSP
jgi:hypothetical protein